MGQMDVPSLTGPPRAGRTRRATEQSMDPIRFVELPRPGAYVPDPSGTQAYTFVTTYNHGLRKSNQSLHLVDLRKQPQTHRVVLDDLVYAEAQWIDAETIVYLRPAQSQYGVPDLDPGLASEAAAKALKTRLEGIPDGGGKAVELWALLLNTRNGGKEECYRVGSFPTQISSLKSQSSEANKAILSFFAEVYAPYDAKALEDVHRSEERFRELDEGSTGMAYDSLFVRHWDCWTDPHGKSSRIYFTQLGFEDGKWMLQPFFRSPFPNLAIPSGPLGEGIDFDVSGSSIVGSAKDPHLNPAWHTRQNIYIVPLFPKHKDDGRVAELTTGDQGATSCPVFSPIAKSTATRDKGKLAWLEMRKDGYEADRNRVIVFDLESRRRVLVAEDWDRSPSRIIWGKDDEEIFLLAEDHGRVKVFRVSITGQGQEEPVCLTKEDSVSDIFYLSEPPRLLLTISSLKTPNTPHILTLDTKNQLTQIASLFTTPLASVELDKGEPFWFEGAEGFKVHGLLVRPPGFRKASGKKWPLLFLIHGGPQSAWNESWNLRWNANAFASAGYIVSMINPSGSTGFGQEFTDSIVENWGGKAYKDLVAAYEYLLKTFSEIDCTRTAALGGSYGGYMVNWLMGHNTGPLDFKAFVSHDGIFNTVSAWSAADELYFPEHDLRGSPITNRQAYEIWNPLNFVGLWKTPCLVIHSRFDYRLPESEGLSVFNCLQRNGIPSRLLYFPDENHWVRNPANSIRWYREIFEFLKPWCPPGAGAGAADEPQLT